MDMTQACATWKAMGNQPHTGILITETFFGWLVGAQRGKGLPCCGKRMFPASAFVRALAYAHGLQDETGLPFPHPWWKKYETQRR